MHLSSSGDLEPCPAAPYSDANLAAVPLRDALQSRLLKRLRETPTLLTKSGGSCALHANRAWVEGLMGRKDLPAGLQDALAGGAKTRDRQQAASCPRNGS